MPFDNLRKPASDLASNVANMSVESKIDCPSALYNVTSFEVKAFKPVSFTLLLTVAATGTDVMTSTLIVFVGSSLFLIVNSPSVLPVACMPVASVMVPVIVVTF